jgi:hypothetical protein
VDEVPEQGDRNLTDKRLLWYFWLGLLWDHMGFRRIRVGNFIGCVLM